MKVLLNDYGWSTADGLTHEVRRAIATDVCLIEAVEAKDIQQVCDRVADLQGRYPNVPGADDLADFKIREVPDGAFWRVELEDRGGGDYVVESLKILDLTEWHQAHTRIDPETTRWLMDVTD